MGGKNLRSQTVKTLIIIRKILKNISCSQLIIKINGLDIVR